MMCDIIQSRRKRPPLAPGEKEKLTREQERTERLRRLKQVRHQEREISAKKLAKYKLSSTIKKIKQQLQNEELCDQIQSLQNAHKIEQLSKRLRNIGTAHRNAEQYLNEHEIRKKCLCYIESENRKLAKHRGVLAALSVREVKRQNEIKLQKQRLSLSEGYTHNATFKRKIRATRHMKQKNERKEQKMASTAEMEENGILSKSGNESIAFTNLNQTNYEDEVSMNHLNEKEKSIDINRSESFDEQSSNSSHFTDPKKLFAATNTVLTRNQSSLLSLENEDIAPRHSCPIPIEAYTKEESSQLHNSKSFPTDDSHTYITLLNMDNQKTSSIQEHSIIHPNIIPGADEKIVNPAKNHLSWSISPPMKKKKGVHRHSNQRHDIAESRKNLWSISPPSKRKHDKQPSRCLLSTEKFHENSGEKKIAKSSSKIQNFKEPKDTIETRKQIESPESKFTTVGCTTGSQRSLEFMKGDHFFSRGKSVSPKSVERCDTATAGMSPQSSTHTETPKASVDDSKKTNNTLFFVKKLKHTQQKPQNSFPSFVRENQCVMNQSSQNCKESQERQSFDFLYNGKSTNFRNSNKDTAMDSFDLNHEIAKLRILFSWSKKKRPMSTGFDLNLQAKLEQILS